MKINTIGELKKLVNKFDDNFKLDIDIMTRIPDEELINSLYPFPWRRTEAVLEYHDTGYSDKVVCFGIYEKEESKL
jgi:hypothetical protein